MFLLNGRTLASDIARDSLKEAMYADPVATDFTYGLVPKVMAFLVVIEYMLPVSPTN